MTGPIRRLRTGRYQIRLDEPERRLLASVVPQLRNLLVSEAGGPGNDPALKRLFPTAHLDDDEREREYQALVGDELLASRLAALDSLERTIEADEVGEDELLGWMRSVNAVRLVLGTRLDVNEEDSPLPDPADPAAPARFVYQWLSYLLDEIVEALEP